MAWPTRHLGDQVHDLRLQPGQRLAEHRDLCGLLRDLGVPLGQKLPQSRIRSAKPGLTAARERLPPRARANAATTPPGPQIGR
jgi:hypothetical protein